MNMAAYDYPLLLPLVKNIAAGLLSWGFWWRLQLTIILIID